MITEDYVSFETAKLLKEKGFDEICSTAYETITNAHEIEQCSFSNWGKLNQVKRPTIQMAMKWLRKVHDIQIEITIVGKPWENPTEWSYGFRCQNKEFIDSQNADYYNSWEEAAEVAIKYCLENLI